MKRTGNLYEKVMTVSNVVNAMEKYNRTRPDYKRRTIDYEWASNFLQKMKEDYKSIIGTPRILEITTNGKQRQLQIPSYESCIAQIALWNICEPYIEKRIHTQSFASRKGYGGHKAARKCRRFVHQYIDTYAKYHLYFDIKKFYQHINKEIVIRDIRRIFKDEKLIELFEIIVNSAIEGLSIGYTFSQSLANLYLVPIYYKLIEIKNISKIYVYMDNWIVFSKYKKPLHKVVDIANKELAKIGCKMKEDWQIAPTAKRPVKICGFIISDNNTRLYKKIYRRILRNIDKITEKPTEKLHRSLMSRRGWIREINREYSPAFMVDGKYLWKNSKRRRIRRRIRKINIKEDSSI